MTKLEDQVEAELGKVKAWIARRAYAAIGIAFAAGFLLGIII